MATVAFIKCLVLQLNGINYYPAGKVIQIPVSNASLEGERNFRPQVDEDGILEGFTTHIAEVGETIGADEIRTIRIRDNNTGNTFYIVPATGVDQSDVADAINGTASADLTTGATIPAAITEVTVTPVSGTYTYKWPFPANPFSRNLTFSFTYNGGQVPGTAFPASHASQAAVATWATANGGVGTWTVVTETNGAKSLKLVSTTAASINVNLGVLDATYCLVVPVPGSAVDIGKIVVKDNANADVTIDVPTFSLHNLNSAAILAAVRSVLSVGAVTFVHMSGTDYRLSYTGDMKPVSLKSPDGTTTTVAWTAGACA